MYSITKWVLPPSSSRSGRQEEANKTKDKKVWGNNMVQYFKSNIQLVTIVAVILSLNVVLFIKRTFKYATFRNWNGGDERNFMFMFSRANGQGKKTRPNPCNFTQSSDFNRRHLLTSIDKFKDFFRFGSFVF
jgi:hypothetical protein